jgi:DNA primase
MFNSPIDEIKSKLDIVEVIGSYIKLHKAGANYKAVCPFHSEKTPSFFVSPARQMWHCFGCGEGHSIFDFVMKIEGIEFGDALRILAQRTGVELKPVSSESAIWRTKRQRLYEICELATKFFEKQLGNSAKGKKAKEYLLGRGITEESIKKWRLGWAPDSWQGLSDFLVAKGYKKEEIEKAGLAITNKGGKYFDRFRERITFPVFDFNSQAVGFGARVLKKTKDTAKYINSPSTILYDKSNILYGLNNAKVDIRKEGFCILAEGYVDVIMAHQSGIENMVATSGTALGSRQLDLLKRYSDNLYLAFDMDFAGDAATKRGIELAQSGGFNIKVVKFPEDKDPADVISENPEAFKKLVEESLSILDFWFQNAFSQFDGEKPEGKREISKVLLPVIKRIPNKIEQSFWVQQLANNLKVKEMDIEEEMKKVKQETPEDTEISVLESENPVLQKTRKQLLEERLISLALKKQDLPQDLINEDVISCFSLENKEILENFKKRKNLTKEANESLDCLILKGDIEEINDKDIISEIKFCSREIKLLSIKDELKGIYLEIKKAEGEKNTEKVNELVKEFSQRSKKIISS